MHARRLICRLPYLVILLACVWAVWPIIGGFSTLIPIRDNHLTTVPLFNAWTIWWNADRVTEAFSNYWQAPIFFPHQNAFALSEPQPATIFAAPVFWVTGSPMAAYNFYLLLSLFLNGLVTFRISRGYGCGRVTATVGALMMVWLPIALRQIEVVQLIPVWPMIWFWDALRRHGRTAAWKSCFEISTAYVVSFYTCIHHTLFLSLLLIPTTWVLFQSIGRRKFWLTSIAAAGFAAVPVLALVIPMNLVLQDEQYERSESLVTKLSAKPNDFLRRPADAMFHNGRKQGLALSAGWMTTALAAIGVVLGMFRSRRRRWILFLILTVAVSALLAMGLNLEIGTLSPWAELSAWLPPLRRVRSVFRFAYLTQMAIILLAVTGLHLIQIYIAARTKRRALATFIVGFLGVIAIAEVPAPKIMIAGAPNLNLHKKWAEFVKNNTAEGKSIVCYPFAATLRAADFEITTRWMYYGSLHGVPIVNGYSGFFPLDNCNLRSEVATNGLSSETLQELADLNVQFLVVDRLQSSTLSFDASALPLRRAFSDSVGIDVYQIITVDEQPP